MNSRNRIVLNKILNEIEEIEEFTEGHSYDTFNENKLLKKAIAMSIINMGELVKALDDDFRSASRILSDRFLLMHNRL
jgi:uncharacterized protein with HEPN domain